MDRKMPVNEERLVVPIHAWKSTGTSEFGVDGGETATCCGTVVGGSTLVS